MRFQKYAMAGAAAFAMAGAGLALNPTVVPPAYAACDPGTPIDNTTGQFIKHLMERAGYSDIRIDQKGCDNVWHVLASKNGNEGRYAVEPGGKIYPEGN